MGLKMTQTSKSWKDRERTDMPPIPVCQIRSDGRIRQVIVQEFVVEASEKSGSCK